MKEIKLSDIFVLNGPVPFYVDEKKKLITYYCPWCGDTAGDFCFEERPSVILAATIGEDFIIKHLELDTSNDCNNFINKVAFDFEPKFRRDVFEEVFKMKFKEKR